MQRIELHANRIAWRERVDFASREAQCFHSRNDSELRQGGERQHEQDQKMTE